MVGSDGGERWQLRDLASGGKAKRDVAVACVAVAGVVAVARVDAMGVDAMGVDAWVLGQDKRSRP